MWSDLTIRHLLALRAVHEEGTFGRAADRLGFTQSAVSQQVGALEQIVGVSLFDRKPGPNPPVLTEAGERLLRHARKLLAGVEDAERDQERLARGLTGTLRVGTFQSVSARLLPMALRRITDEAPDVEIVLVGDELRGGSRHDSVRRGEVDLAFVIGDVEDGFAEHSLGADPHVAVVPAEEPPGPIDLLDVGGRPFVGLPADDNCADLVDRGLERLGVKPRYAFRSSDNGAVQGMVAAGVGIAVMPLLALDASDPEVSLRTTIPELAPRPISIVWDPDQDLSPVATRFIEIVSEICKVELGNTAGRAVGER